MLVGITGARDEAMKTAAKAAGLAVLVSGKSRKAEPVAPGHPPNLRATPVAPVQAPGGEQGPRRAGALRPADLCRRHLLVVLGSVSLGAEVIADDSIHVYGALRWPSAIAGLKAIPCPHLLPAIAGRAALHRGAPFQLSDALPAGPDPRASPYPAGQRTTSNRPHQIELQGSENGANHSRYIGQRWRWQDHNQRGPEYRFSPAWPQDSGHRF